MLLQYRTSGGSRRAAETICALVDNCGGPGCPTVTILHQLGTVLFPDETRARFDLVGFDPRDVGESGQIDCRPDYETHYALDPSPNDDAEWDDWLAGGRLRRLRDLTLPPPELICPSTGGLFAGFG